MNRLRYPLKFALIGAVCGLPLAVVMYFFQSEVNANIAFATSERQGVVYDRPLTQMLMDVLQHQKAAGMEGKQTTPSNDEIASLARTVDADIEAVDAADRRVGSALM